MKRNYILYLDHHALRKPFCYLFNQANRLQIYIYPVPTNSENMVAKVLSIEANLSTSQTTTQHSLWHLVYLATWYLPSLVITRM